jgi:hypothetical protein
MVFGSSSMVGTHLTVPVLGRDQERVEDRRGIAVIRQVLVRPRARRFPASRNGSLIRGLPPVGTADAPGWSIYFGQEVRSFRSP